jgi:UDPglucose 6-dehydrogenase
MKVVVVGSGYVGLVTGACLSDTGASVVCVDVNAEKISGLQRGEIPIFEPGLDELVARNAKKGRLMFSTDLVNSLTNADVLFIAVGTPPGADGSADIAQVLGVGKAIGAALASRPTEYLVVVTKSTVPVGTSAKLSSAIAESIETELSTHTRSDGRIHATSGGSSIGPSLFDVASNPEFLKEGAAIDDFAKPDRIVIGVESERAQAVLERLYRPFLLNARPVIFMDLASAEITKYAANAMLATRISFMNSIAVLCDAVGADVSLVRRGIGTDARIGSSFLYPGVGYGGSCFPKDVRALHATAEDLGVDFGILREVEAANERQKRLAVSKARLLLDRPIGSLEGLVFGLWGLAFKPNTDDIRDAPALATIQELLADGAEVRLYDPVAKLPEALLKGVRVCEDPYEASQGADVLVLVTEWPEFRTIDPAQLGMRQKLIVDGRNVLDVDQLVEHGFTIASIGRPTKFPDLKCDGAHVG